MCYSEHQPILMLAKSNVPCVRLSLLCLLIEYGVDLIIIMLMVILMAMSTFRYASLYWETLEWCCQFQQSMGSTMIPSWHLCQLGHSHSVCETWTLRRLTTIKVWKIFVND